MDRNFGEKIKEDDGDSPGIDNLTQDGRSDAVPVHDRSNPNAKPAELGPCPCGVDSPRHDPPTCASRMAPFLPPPVTAHALRLRLRRTCELLAASPRPVRADCRSPKERFRYGERPRAPPLRPPVVPVPVRAPPRARARPCLYCVRVTSGDGTDGADGGPGESPTGWGETWPLATMQCPSSAWQMPCHRQTAMYTGHCTRRPTYFRTGSVAAVVRVEVVHCTCTGASVPCLPLPASNWCRGWPLRPACTTATGEWRPASGRAGSGAMPFLGDVRVRQASRQHKVYLTLSPPL